MPTQRGNRTAELREFAKDHLGVRPKRQYQIDSIAHRMWRVGQPIIDVEALKCRVHQPWHAEGENERQDIGNTYDDPHPRDMDGAPLPYVDERIESSSGSALPAPAALPGGSETF